MPKNWTDDAPDTTDAEPVEAAPEPEADPVLVHPHVDVATRTPAENLASRDNIVPDGPGTVADHLPTVVQE